METSVGIGLRPFYRIPDQGFMGKDMKRNMVIVIAAVIVVAIVGGLYAQSMPTTRTIKLQALDFFFLQPGSTTNNPTITVRAGDTIVLTMENQGSKNDHEFFIVTQADYDKYITALQNGQEASEPEPAFPNAAVEDVPAGQSKTGTFVVGQPGTYVYACLDKEGTEPLTHAHKGMYGTFVVQSGGIFSISRSLGNILSGTATTTLTNIPSIALWQAAIVLALAIAIKRQ